MQFFRLVENAVGRDLSELLGELRDQGLSYEAIARTLGSDYGVPVTRQTVSKWIRLEESKC